MDSYFIKINDGQELRREILSASKASLHVLKTQTVIAALRDQKLELTAQLRQDLRELNLMLAQLEKLMPQLPPSASEMLSKNVKITKQVIRKKKLTLSKDELLQSKLDSVNQKLRMLQ